MDKARKYIKILMFIAWYSFIQRTIYDKFINSYFFFSKFNRIFFFYK